MPQKPAIQYAFFSMEMKDVRLADRLLIGLSGINADNYRQGNLSENDLFLFQKAKEELAKYPIYIDASPVCILKVVSNPETYYCSA